MAVVSVLQIMGWINLFVVYVAVMKSRYPVTQKFWSILLTSIVQVLNTDKARGTLIIVTNSDGNRNHGNGDGGNRYQGNGL